MLLENQIVLVTGGSRGIGKAAALACAREGAHIIINYAGNVKAAEETVKEISDLGQKCLAVQADISKLADVERLIEEATAEFGKIDILVNNAGITRDKTIAKMSIDQWRSVLNVNLKAVIQLTEIFIENGFSKDAKVVSLSSISGISGNVGQTNYSLTKAGVIGFSQALAATNKNIFANAVAPGFIETKMTENLPFFIKEGGRRLSTLKQGGKPEDVAELIGFLASPLSNGINGQCVRVCGGNMIGA